MLIRKAVEQDVGKLNAVAYMSKAYWGYSKEFLDKSNASITVTKEYLEEYPTYILELNENIIAFYSFSFQPNRLEAMFIEPNYIGKGFGRLLWSDVMQKAIQFNWTEFVLDSDPNAEGFYIRMGAKRLGTIPSPVIPNRVLPVMQVKVE